jgi:hypothetical protein
MGAGVASSTIGPIPSASDMHTSFYIRLGQTIGALNPGHYGLWSPYSRIVN